MLAAVWAESNGTGCSCFLTPRSRVCGASPSRGRFQRIPLCCQNGPSWRGGRAVFLLITQAWVQKDPILCVCVLRLSLPLCSVLGPMWTQTTAGSSWALRQFEVPENHRKAAWAGFGLGTFPRGVHFTDGNTEAWATGTSLPSATVIQDRQPLFSLLKKKYLKESFQNAVRKRGVPVTCPGASRVVRPTT